MGSECRDSNTSDTTQTEIAKPAEASVKASGNGDSIAEKMADSSNGAHLCDEP